MRMRVRTARRPRTIPSVVSVELADTESSGDESSSTVDGSSTRRAPAAAGKLGKCPLDFLCLFPVGIGRAVEGKVMPPFLLLEGGKNMGTGPSPSATGAGLGISLTLNTLLRTLGVVVDAVVVCGVVLPRAFTRVLLTMVLPLDFELRFLKLCVRWFTGVAGALTCDEGVEKVFAGSPVTASTSFTHW